MRIYRAREGEARDVLLAVPESHYRGAADALAAAAWLWDGRRVPCRTDFQSDRRNGLLCDDAFDSAAGASGEKAADGGYLSSENIDRKVFATVNARMGKI